MDNQVKEEVKKLQDMTIDEVIDHPKVKEAFVKNYGDDLGDINHTKESNFAKIIIKSKDYTKGIANSNKLSLYVSMIKLAFSKLSLDPSYSQAYLLPRDKAIMFEPSYKGKLELLISTGSIAGEIASEVVYKGEDFTVIDSVIHHNMKFPRPGKSIDDVIAAYTKVRMPDSEEKHVPIDINEILIRRGESKSWAKNKENKSEVWNKYYVEMCIKCALNKLWKTLPKTNESSIYAKLYKETIEQDNIQIQQINQGIEQPPQVEQQPLPTVTDKDLQNSLNPDDMPFD